MTQMSLTFQGLSWPFDGKLRLTPSPRPAHPHRLPKLLVQLSSPPFFMVVAICLSRRHVSGTCAWPTGEAWRILAERLNRDTHSSITGAPPHRK